MRRLVVALFALVAIVALTACTRHQLALWVDWYAVDPVAAIEYANRPEVAAELASVPPPEASSRYGDAVWRKIAACESGGRVDHPPVRNSSGVYSGYLMIGHRWWPVYGGTAFASAPYLATRAQQIVVAERIADDVGLDAGWQCW